MNDDNGIITALSIEGLDADAQTAVIEEAQRRIGEAVEETLSEAQINEYQAIIDNGRAVIDAWLEQHLPDYKDTELYKVIEEGRDDDPEHIEPERVIASVGWTQLNIPQQQEIMDRVIAEYRKELEAARV